MRDIQSAALAHVAPLLNAHFKLIAAVLQLPTDLATTMRLPALYVGDGSSSASANELLQGVRQQIQTSIDCFIAMPYSNGANKGEEQTLHALRNAVHQQLLGWQPQHATTACTYVRGLVVEWRSQCLLYKDMYQLSYWSST